MNEYFERLYCRACDADNAKVWQNHAMYGSLVEAIKALRDNPTDRYSLKEAKDIVEAWVARGCVLSEKKANKTWSIPNHSSDPKNVTRKVIANADGTYSLETVYVVKFSDVGALVEWVARSYDSK